MCESLWLSTSKRNFIPFRRTKSFEVSEKLCFSAERIDQLKSFFLLYFLYGFVFWFGYKPKFNPTYVGFVVQLGQWLAPEAQSAMIRASGELFKKVQKKFVAPVQIRANPYVQRCLYLRHLKMAVSQHLCHLRSLFVLIPQLKLWVLQRLLQIRI